MYIIPSFSTPLVSRAKNETIGDFSLLKLVLYFISRCFDTSGLVTTDKKESSP